MTSKDSLKYYYDVNFLGSSDARPIRIMCEYTGPYQRLKRYNINHTIVFFGSARISQTPGNALFAQKASAYYEKARELAYSLTKWSFSLSEDLRPHILTGGGPGIMEAANRGADEAGGVSIGMSISLPHEQGMNQYCTNGASMEFHYFFMRKYWLLFKTRVFVAFPGGIGTFDELFETLTLIQTKKLRKFPIILFGSEYWNSVINFQAMIDWGLISPSDINLFKIIDDVDEADEYIKSILTADYLAAAVNH